MVLCCSGACLYVLEGTWSHLAGQAAQGTPIMHLAMQGAALHNWEAPPAWELWICTHQSTWEGSHGGVERRDKALRGLYTLQKTPFGIRRQALSGEFISFIRLSDTSKRKKAGKFWGTQVSLVFAECIVWSNKRHDPSLQVLPLLLTLDHGSGNSLLGIVCFSTET